LKKEKKEKKKGLLPIFTMIRAGGEKAAGRFPNSLHERRKSPRKEKRTEDHGVNLHVLGEVDYILYIRWR